jgi:hypothetical protein
MFEETDLVLNTESVPQLCKIPTYCDHRNVESVRQAYEFQNLPSKSLFQTDSINLIQEHNYFRSTSSQSPLCTRGPTQSLRNMSEPMIRPDHRNTS